MSSTAHGNAGEVDYRMDVVALAAQPAAASAAPRTAAPAGEPAVAPGMYLGSGASQPGAGAPNADCGASSFDRWALAWITRTVATESVDGQNTSGESRT